MTDRTDVLTGLRAATMAAGAAPYGLIDDAAIVLAGGMIDWIGPRAELPANYRGQTHHDLEGRLVTPALIDCHTHIVHLSLIHI